MVAPEPGCVAIASFRGTMGMNNSVIHSHFTQASYTSRFRCDHMNNEEINYVVYVL